MKDLDDCIALAAELKSRCEALNDKFDALFSGPTNRKPQKCSKCGEEGHSARTCSKPHNGLDADMRKEPTFGEAR